MSNIYLIIFIVWYEIFYVNYNIKCFCGKSIDIVIVLLIIFWGRLVLSVVYFVL